MALLEIDNLTVEFGAAGNAFRAVDSVGLDIDQGEVVGVVGESGSGKSTLARAVMRLLPASARVGARRLMFDGIDLAAQDESAMRSLRGARLAMIFQDARMSMNPVMKVGRQIAETLEAHAGAPPREARARALEMLAKVRIRDPQRVFDSYPFELSGGMCQRAMIAMMLLAGPDLLIADEATSALDVTVRLQVLAVLDDLVRAKGMGLLFISHDLELVRSFCDRVVVVYGGRVVEEIAAGDLATARHPYTRGLLACVPRLRDERGELPVVARDPAWLEESRGEERTKP